MNFLPTNRLIGYVGMYYTSLNINLRYLKPFRTILNITVPYPSPWIDILPAVFITDKPANPF